MENKDENIIPSYEEGREGIKSKDKYLDPIKNSTFGEKDFTEERVSFNPITRNELNEDRISYSKEYEILEKYLIEYDENVLKKEKPKKNDILNIWNSMKSKYSYISLIIFFDIITDFFCYHPTKLYNFLSIEDKQKLYDELQERL